MNSLEAAKISIERFCNDTNYKPHAEIAQSLALISIGEHLEKIALELHKMNGGIDLETIFKEVPA